MPINRHEGTEVFSTVILGKEGSRLNGLKHYTANVDPLSVDANSIETLDVAVVGVKTSGVLVGYEPGGAVGLGIGAVYISADDVISVEFSNPTVAAIDAVTSVWNFVVAEFA